MVASCAVSPVNTTPLNALPTASPGPGPTATPGAGPSPGAFPCGNAAATATGTVSNPAVGTAINFPALGSCSSSITFQAGTTFGAGTSINVTTSLAAPAGAPSPLPTNPSTGTSTPKTLIFELLTLTAGTVTVPAGTNTSPLQSVTIANAGTCVTYGQAFGTPAGGWQGVSAGTISGLTVTFPGGQNSGSTTLTVAGSPYILAFLCY